MIRSKKRVCIVTKITTVIMDYDSTLHDHEAVITRGLDGVFELRGEELHRIYKYDIHRAARVRDRHDDAMFHCELLFKHLGIPFD
jgi:hypothetical protein